MPSAAHPHPVAVSRMLIENTRQPAAALRSKIGIMAQPLRIELMQWLHSRY